jgi:PAS domain-containing protein
MLGAVMETAANDVSQMTLALVEAQVGSLVDFLPVALLIADAEGAILRANRAAHELLESGGPLVGQWVSDVLLGQEFDVRQRWLRHDEDVLRLYVINASAR